MSMRVRRGEVDSGKCILPHRPALSGIIVLSPPPRIEVMPHGWYLVKLFEFNNFVTVFPEDDTRMSTCFHTPSFEAPALWYPVVPTRVLDQDFGRGLTGTATAVTVVIRGRV
jgi:hypothetical protein